MSPEVDQHTKATDIIMHRVLSVFGRNISEDTYAVLTAGLALCLEGVERGAHTAPSTLRALYLSLKRSFARYKKMEASVRLEVLPTRPQDFRTLVGEAAYGAIYTVAAPPVPYKLPMGHLGELAQKVVKRDKGNAANALALQEAERKRAEEAAALQAQIAETEALKKQLEDKADKGTFSKMIGKVTNYLTGKDKENAAP